MENNLKQEFNTNLSLVNIINLMHSNIFLFILRIQRFTLLLYYI